MRTLFLVLAFAAAWNAAAQAQIWIMSPASQGRGHGGAAPTGCASPTAPNGVVDLSQCSNAFYIAVIL